MPRQGSDNGPRTLSSGDAHFHQSQLCSNRVCGISIGHSMAKRFAAIQVESATWSGGDKLDYWVKERQQWWGAYAVLTAVRGGSELLIFVLRAGGKTRPESNRRALHARTRRSSGWSPRQSRVLEGRTVAGHAVWNAYHRTWCRYRELQEAEPLEESTRIFASEATTQKVPGRCANTNRARNPD